MPARTHLCPGGCGQNVPYHQLSCKPDWFRLPKVLRDEVNAAYRARQANPERHHTALREALRWYADNQRPAVGPGR